MTEAPATHFLLYLNEKTFVGPEGLELALEVGAAMALQTPIVMCHETDPDKGGCEFVRFFATTPQELISAGIYKPLAVYMARGAEYREISHAMLAQKLGGKEPPKSMHKRLQQWRSLERSSSYRRSVFISSTASRSVHPSFSHRSRDSRFSTFMPHRRGTSRFSFTPRRSHERRSGEGKMSTMQAAPGPVLAPALASAMAEHPSVDQWRNAERVIVQPGSPMRSPAMRRGSTSSSVRPSASAGRSSSNAVASPNASSGHPRESHSRRRSLSRSISFPAARSQSDEETSPNDPFLSQRTWVVDREGNLVRNLAQQREALERAIKEQVIRDSLSLNYAISVRDDEEDKTAKVDFASEEAA